MATHFLCLLFLASFLLLAKSGHGGDVSKSIGAIVNNDSLQGKHARLAMEIAINDCNHITNQNFGLRVSNSHGDGLQAAIAAKDLIYKHKVAAVLGPQAWQEASVIADVAGEAHVPILSLADTTPRWATERWPFLVQASSSQHLQMRAVAAVVQSWGWRQVTVIHEDIDSSMDMIVSHLFNAARESGLEITNVVALPPFDSSSIKEQLEKLKQEQWRVFVVHLSLELGLSFFEQAKEMGMMEKDYVWITTSAFTNMIENATRISLQGVVGIKSYIPEGKSHCFQEFRKRFLSNFSRLYPNESHNQPSISAAQAYDAALVTCSALNKTSRGGQNLLDQILTSDFRGVSGEIQFENKTLPPTNTFQIINVAGKEIKELGFWSDKFGFSKSIVGETNNSSMQSLGNVSWPGAPSGTPRGWATPAIDKPLRIGVPVIATFKQYVNAVCDPINNNNSFEGFAIDLFNATVQNLPYPLHYNFSCYDGTYDDLVKQVHSGTLDAVVGDVAIVASRYQYAEFTHPFTEAGLWMIVPVRKQTSKRELLFTKPFTKAMWCLAVAINLYNGFVVWLIERNYSPDLRGSPLNQIGTLLWLSFTTLVSQHGEKLHSNLSRMAMIMWLFVALVITQTYTANLTSILTSQRLEPSVTDIQTLQSSNAKVGYCNGTFVMAYLIDVLHFRADNIKNYSTPEDYAQGLRNKEISAAFLEAPYAKLFLKKYKDEFIKAGPSYKVGGFGFVFPRGSPLLHDVTKALVNVSETGQLRDLEDKMLGSEKSEKFIAVDEEISSLSPKNFAVLFLLTAGTSSIALLVYIIHCKLKQMKSRDGGIREAMTFVMQLERRWFSRRVSDIEMATNPALVLTNVN